MYWILKIQYWLHVRDSFLLIVSHFMKSEKENDIATITMEIIIQTHTEMV